MLNLKTKEKAVEQSKKEKKMSKEEMLTQLEVKRNLNSKELKLLWKKKNNKDFIQYMSRIDTLLLANTYISMIKKGWRMIEEEERIIKPDDEKAYERLKESKEDFEEATSLLLELI